MQSSGRDGQVRPVARIKLDVLLRTLLSALPELVEEKVDDRRGVERERLTKDEPAHNRDAEWSAQFGTHAARDDQRQRAEQGGRCGHQNWPKT